MGRSTYLPLLMRVRTRCSNRRQKLVLKLRLSSRSHATRGQYRLIIVNRQDEDLVQQLQRKGREIIKEFCNVKHIFLKEDFIRKSTKHNTKNNAPQLKFILLDLIKPKLRLNSNHTQGIERMSY